MPKTIAGAVGRGGRNFPPVDVMTVQYLLNCVPAGQGGPSPELAVDGAAGPKTIAAIEKYQRSLGAVPDGRVDPGGRTLHALQARDPYPQQSLPSGGAKGGQPAGKGAPFGKGGGNQQAGGWPGGKGSDPYGKSGGGNQGGYPPGGKGGGGFPPGGKGGGGFPPGKGGPPFGGGGGMPFPGGKGGGGKGF